MSAIAFAPRCPEAASSALTHLVQVLRSRLRSTDEIGWFDREQIGALLPSTSATGAWKVADKVCAMFPEAEPPPICTVYTYPSDASTANGSSAPNGHAQAAPGRNAAALGSLFARPLPVWKRCLDVVGAAAGLAIAAPLLGVIAAAVRLSSPGPVFFRQWRSGRGGKPFKMIKFRSMIPDAEAKRRELASRNEQDGPAFKMKNDPRVTTLGRFLRKTSLDELPQLWNVLRGDMSLVGPRPLPLAETAACEAWQRRRLDVTPGLTCIWQVRGRGRVAFADWVRMDMEYIRKHSPWQDLKLLLLTVPAVLLRRGAH
ncbi:MAG TPA: sugar transferase [Gemmataceae bacterium]|nr:sugar transferase [Gemmataceae bacterium]